MNIFTMPKLSPTMHSGVVSKWYKKLGDYVKDGDPLLEVVTDKSSMEVDSSYTGYVRHIFVVEGGRAGVNDPLVLITISADEPFQLKDLLGKQDSVVTSEESKPAVDGGSNNVKLAGFVDRNLVDEQSYSRVPSSADVYIPHQLDGPSFEDGCGSAKRSVTPLARKLANERGINLDSISTGSGPGGRIVASDVRKLGKPMSGIMRNRYKQPPKFPPGSFRRKELDPVKKTVGDLLSLSKQSIPHFYLHRRIECSKLWDLYQTIRHEGEHITINDLIIRGAALSLRAHPIVNSGYDPSTGELMVYETVDVAIAMDSPMGLITPIVRNADYKDIFKISEDVRYLASLANAGRLKSAQYQGGSFTVSNLGMFGVESFQSIINPPQVAILSVGAVVETAVIENGMVRPGRVIAVSMSCDHRVLEGVDGAKFLASLSHHIETPMLLLM